MLLNSAKDEKRGLGSYSLDIAAILKDRAWQVELGTFVGAYVPTLLGNSHFSQCL